MATIYINYYKPPRYEVRGRPLEVVGDFISSVKLVTSGASVATANPIPDGTGVITIYGDADFALSIADVPTASDADTSERLAGNFMHVKEYNSVRPTNTEKIAVINI